MADYSGESDFKYVSGYEDIPITGSGLDDTWQDDPDKLNAIQAGEEKLEADVNDGNEIGSPTDLHAEAAAAWATYRLVLGIKAPDSNTRGDSLDEGTERMQFASALKSMYWEYVDSITGASGVESEGGPDEVDFLVADWP